MKFQDVLLLVVSHAAFVQAGSRAWEASLSAHAANDSQTLFPRAASSISGVSDYGSNSTGRAGYLGKRWIGNPNEPTKDFVYKLWDKANIPACFEDKSHQYKGASKTTEEILSDDLTAAKKLWEAVGVVNKDGYFNFEFKDNDWCKSARRNDYLLISYAGEGVRKMATSPGQAIRTSEDPRPNEAGSSMVLSNLLTMGMKNVVSNYAHEMGVSSNIFPLARKLFATVLTFLTFFSP